MGNDVFVKSDLLHHELEQEVTEEVKHEIQEGVAMAELRNDMSHMEFLQALPEVVRSNTEDRTPIGKMQRMKERELEFVRWRSVNDYYRDASLFVKLEDMRRKVHLCILEEQLNE